MITAGLLIIFFVILLVVFNSKHAINKVYHESLQKDIKDLSKEVRELKEQIGKLNAGQPAAPAQARSEPTVAHKPQERVVEPPKATPVQERKDPLAQPQPQKPIPVIEAPERKHLVVEQEEKPGWFDRWLQNNPDIEKFIGENLINKIGIAVLVLGIAFFVKYAIDKDWVNETGRVINGLVCGGILVALAHRLRNSYRSFSSVLVGGGIAVFYTTIAFAFHEYKLIDQTSAFFIMIVITAFAVVLSILYNRIELGMLATIGGFITPFLVSTGQSNYHALFTYMSILSSGLLVLAYFKRWQIVYFTAFLFTLFIYGAWLFDEVDSFNYIPPYEDALMYATIFYFIFLAMHVVNNIKTKRKFSGVDFASLLMINFAYYAAGVIALQYWDKGDYQGLFTAGLGVVNLALAFTFFRQRNADKNFVYLLIGLTLTFLSLAAPVQLEGNYITLFWSAEAVLLFWLYQRSGIKLIKYSSAIVAVLTFISLAMDWVNIYGVNREEIPIIINKGFLTSLFVVLAMGVMYRLLYREADTYYLSPLTNQNVRNITGTTAILILLLVGIMEIHYQFNNRLPDTGLHFTYIQLYVLAFICTLFVVTERFGKLKDPFLRMGIPLVCFLLYLFNIQNIYETEKLLLTTGNHRQYFTAQWASIILIFTLAAITIRYFRNNTAQQPVNRNVFTWFMTFALVTVLSLEGRHIMVWFNYQGQSSIFDIENLYYKAGMTMIWGLSSFTMMYLGMKHKFKPLRIVSLVLFGATLIKLFTFDIRNIPPGGKIAAFILLGVLLLTVSFMYQRLKKLIIDDATNQG